jgi:hypothetical protein
MKPLTAAEREELRALAGIAAKEPQDPVGPLLRRLLAQLEATEAERDRLDADLDTAVEEWSETGRLWAEEHRRAIAAAVEAEREACAELTETAQGSRALPGSLLARVADAIRARAGKETDDGR